MMNRVYGKAKGALGAFSWVFMRTLSFLSFSYLCMHGFWDSSEPSEGVSEKA